MSFDVSDFLRGLEGEGKRRAIAAGEAAVDKFANHVIGQAQDLAPVETGALKSSGVAEKAEFVGHDIRAVVGFNTDYAAAVHERLDLHHDQGQAKFLETAMRTEAHKLRPFVESEMRKAL
ncbi:MAG: hypothetical protein IT445_03140 [Phycisphaeraceae bacterium]|nr:hypothetical protein [Phycisphaeraceae bacterium]